jgi:hypothetical protein
MQSSDGQCTRFIANIDNAWNAVWLFDVPANPTVGWANPVIARAYRDGLTYANSNDNATAYGKIGATTATFFFTSEGYGSAMLGENQYNTNDLDEKYMFSPMGLVTTASGVRGRHGTLQDMWWGPINQYVGSTFPSDASRQYAMFADMLFPWNGIDPVYPA